METLSLISRDEVRSLEASIESRIQEIILDRRIQGPIDPKYLQGDFDFDGVRFSKRNIDLLTLILLVRFSNLFQDFEEYILYDVREYLERNLLFPELVAMINSREATVLLLQSYSRRSNFREIFGTVLDPNRIERVVRSVSLKLLRPQRPKKPQRYRGYRDHGTLRPNYRWIETSDLSFTEEQNCLEEKREEYTNLVTSMVHQAGDWLLKSLREEVSQ